ncbi:MAG: sodium:calcium antiporter [Candidatus Ryanbacteria bacterium]|nr:sodium:calcium antiporter [Candidatus Ryanbacteria bacterium]
MQTSAHVFTFLFSTAIVWFFAGMLIESVDRVAKRFHKTGFSVAFFVLGVLTSLSEISVAINATIDRVPQVSVGNLVGASFVVLLFIIPFLAIGGNGINLKHTISKSNMMLAWAVIVLPAFLVIDGHVTRIDGITALIAYSWLIRAIHRQRELKKVSGNVLEQKGALLLDALKIVIGAGAIFIAGRFLVEQAVYFSVLLDVPSSLIGLILLSVGTNVPEFVIAARSILKKHKDIAFGDYIGSAAANTPIFGLLALMNGGFLLEPSQFFITTVLMVIGLFSINLFARTRGTISRKEGLVLILFYVVFLLVQLASIV